MVGDKVPTWTWFSESGDAATAEPYSPSASIVIGGSATAAQDADEQPAAGSYVQPISATRGRMLDDGRTASASAAIGFDRPNIE